MEIRKRNRRVINSLHGKKIKPPYMGIIILIIMLANFLLTYIGVIFTSSKLSIVCIGVLGILFEIFLGVEFVSDKKTSVLKTIFEALKEVFKNKEKR
ncbi:hypothetical protein K5V21_18885 [Clostridium sardiniense]|uniref:Transporter n=1 Tax=Clostridium sardiniense TaxID=29369 RepID=A0ABS7L318_CLOSR|nr:hypothetical protein [Clostridium sardiniense]MBY0757469.1 hypothetical protein [Clostridium sardiniense]MDQ0462246.1 D-alanyl-lipoteichoic acid acyltransferase DltB (MBOAT superfamily) [Clostridium sardiniense]